MHFCSPASVACPGVSFSAPRMLDREPLVNRDVSCSCAYSTLGTPAVASDPRARSAKWRSFSTFPTFITPYTPSSPNMSTTRHLYRSLLRELRLSVRLLWLVVSVIAREAGKRSDADAQSKKPRAQRDSTIIAQFREIISASREAESLQRTLSETRDFLRSSRVHAVSGYGLA